MKQILVIFVTLLLQFSDSSVWAQTPSITCPGNKTVSTGNGTCSAIVNNISPSFSPTNTTLYYSITSGETSELGTGSVSGKSFYLGVNTIKYSLPDYPGTSCSFTITVEDHQPPVINCPPNITVNCTREVPLPALPSATDACTAFNSIDVQFVSDVISNQTCPHRYKITRTYKATDASGNTTTCSQMITVFDNEGPLFDQPPPTSPLNVSCPANVPPVFPNNYTARDECNPEDDDLIIVFKEVKTTGSCSNKYSLTRTWTATDICGNKTVYTQIINVNDTQAPVFDGPAPSPSILVSTANDIPPPDVQTATDNCGGSSTVTLTEVKSNVQCVNRFTLTRTWQAIDACGNTATRIQVITVNDTEAPQLTSVTADKIILWPPNHKMRDETINYTATDNAEVTSTLSVISSDPVIGTSDGDLSPDWEIIDEHHLRLRAEKANNGQARYYTVATTVSDGCNAPVVGTVTIVVAHNITSPQAVDPYKIGSTVSLNGSFWDKPGNVHTAKWLLDEAVATNGVVAEPSGNQNGKISGSYKFNEAGVYKLQMNVIDQNGIVSYANTNNDLDAMVVIYDPNGGNAYGGGWFQSQPGALDANPSAIGKASYGFAVNYSNAAKPKGETQFEFKVGSFEFNALNFDYLSINSARAQFRGTGKITGGQSGIGFIMTVKDGAIDGSGIDKIRMKIYNRNTGYVYYDNQPGGGDADDPATAVGTNSSIVIQGPATVNASAASREVMEVDKQENGFDKLQLVAYPNPGNKYFSIQIKTSDLKTRMQMQTFDQYGRLLEKRENIIAGSVIKLGEMYRPGIYYVHIIQGQQHNKIKLVKLSE